MVYTFIDAHRRELPIEQCRTTMKVSRSAFHPWRQRQANPTTKMLDDADLAELIAKIHDQPTEPTGGHG